MDGQAIFKALWDFAIGIAKTTQDIFEWFQTPFKLFGETFTPLDLTGPVIIVLFVAFLIFS